MKKIPFSLNLIKITLILGSLLPFKMFSQTYCPVPQGLCDDWFYEISVSNLSFAGDSLACANGVGYYPQDTIFMVAGEAYSANVVVGKYWNNDVIAYIDYNADGTFGEDEAMSFLFVPAQGIKTAVFAPAPDLTPSTFRVRFILYLPPDVPDPCTGALLGASQVIDFPVKIVTEIPGKKGNPYCAASGRDSCESFISQVTFADISRASDFQDCMGSNKYTYYSSDTAHITATAGGTTTTPIEVTLDRYANVNVTAWIDWNQDSIFGAGTDEKLDLVFSGDPVVNGFIYRGTVTTPNTAKIGLTRMRLRASPLTPNMSPCDSSGYEVEDYVVFYTDPARPIPACVTSAGASPSDNAIGVCNGLDSLKWTAVAGVTGYRITLYDSATGDYIFQNINTTSNFITVPTLLSPGSTYRWIAQAYNANGSASGCDSLTFYTSPNLDPVVSIFPSADTVQNCTNIALLLDGNPNQGTTPFTHTWTAVGGSPITNLSSSNTQTTNFTSAGTGVFKYYYAATDNNGCTASDSVIINVNNSPGIGPITPADSVLCAGETATFTLSHSPGSNVVWESSADNAVWNVDPTVTPVGATQFKTAALTEDTYYRATATYPVTNCSVLSNTRLISVNPLPVIPAVGVSPGATVCQGQVVTLTLTTTDNVKWNDAANTSGNIVNINTPGSYYATVTNPDGCVAYSDTTQVIHNSLPPKPVITLIASSPLCDGDAAILKSSYSSNNLWNTGATGENQPVSADGVFTVRYTDANGCSSVSDAFTVNFGEIPATPVISQANNTLNAASNGATYKWFGPNGEVSGADDAALDPAVKGNYRVVAYSPEGCASDTSNVFYFSFVGISEHTASFLTLYPNPAADELNIRSSKAGGMTVTIFNVFGQEVMAVDFAASEGRVKISQLPAGSYLVKVRSGEEEQIRIFQVVR